METATRKQRALLARPGEILAPAERVLGQKGLPRAPLADIVRASGVVAGTLRLFFPRKNSPFCGIRQEGLDGGGGEIRKAGAQEPSVPERIAALTLARFRLGERHPERFRTPPSEGRDAFRGAGAGRSRSSAGKNDDCRLPPGSFPQGRTSWRLSRRSAWPSPLGHEQRRRRPQDAALGRRVSPGPGRSDAGEQHAQGGQET